MHGPIGWLLVATHMLNRASDMVMAQYSARDLRHSKRFAITIHRHDLHRNAHRPARNWAEMRTARPSLTES